MTVVEGRVGEKRTASGSVTEYRVGPYGEQVVADGLPKYFELTRYNRLFTSMVKAVTIAATHNSPLNAVTATPVVGIQNPPGSGKAMVLMRYAFLTTSGTPAGGQAVLNVIPVVTTQTTAAVTGSIFSHLLSNSGASPQGSVMKPYNNVALTALAPVVANEVALLGGATAVAAAGNAGPGQSGEDIAGQFIVPPGTFVAIMAGSGAGTTWIVNAGLTWAEIDWPL